MSLTSSEDDGTSNGFVVKAIEWLAGALALAGGIVLIGVAAITVTSVLGRKLMNHAIAGDFEMVEIGCAVAIALFLPYCQLKSGNVIVDFFTLRLSTRGRRILDMIGCLLVSAVAGLMAWRLALGGWSLYTSNDQTMVLQLGTWWSFLVLVPCMFLLSIIGLLTAWRACRGSWTDSATPSEEPFK